MQQLSRKYVQDATYAGIKTDKPGKRILIHWINECQVRYCKWQYAAVSSNLQQVTKITCTLSWRKDELPLVWWCNTKLIEKCQFSNKWFYDGNLCNKNQTQIKDKLPVWIRRELRRFQLQFSMLPLVSLEFPLIAACWMTEHYWLSHLQGCYPASENLIRHSTTGARIGSTSIVLTKGAVE